LVLLRPNWGWTQCGSLAKLSLLTRDFWVLTFTVHAQYLQVEPRTEGFESQTQRFRSQTFTRTQAQTLQQSATGSAKPFIGKYSTHEIGYCVFPKLRTKLTKSIWFISQFITSQ
jgi:hypothetical protein